MNRRPAASPRRTRRRDERGAVVPAWMMLAAIVLVAIAAASYLAGLGKSSDAAEAADSARTASSSSSASASSSAPSSPSSPAGKPSASPTTTAPSKAPTPATTPEPVRPGQTNVSVFNNSSRTGLAARTSTKVEAAGWKVVGTDNWYGSIPTSTVYFPAGMKAAARQLADDAGIDRVKPAVSPMKDDRLTLIVTSDYRA